MQTIAPLSGLVLSGGHSKRMQRDKAALMIGHETQLARAVRLLSATCDEVFISVRPDQTDDPVRRPYRHIVDQMTNVGPAAGILAAFASRPDHAWLVVAVDLPRLDMTTLQALVRARQPALMATAYRSSSDGLPEPLCAIWEPSSRAALETFLSGGRNCPRKFLLNHPVQLADLPSEDALANVNTPEEYAAFVADTGYGAPP